MNELPPFEQLKRTLAQHRIAITLKSNLERISPQSQSYLIAVSGGPDSTALLVLAWSLGLNVEAAHINYNLRGKDSDEDEAFCSRLCATLNIPIHTKILDTNSEMAKSGKSLQTFARDIRYSFFETVCNEREIDTILTAHHLDDSIESFFINLLRGTGIKGLTGIPEKRGNIARPLLTLKKASILLFLKEFSIPFRQDQTNNENTYVRNQIRNKLLPIIKDIQPSYLDIMQSDMDRLRSSAQMISNQINKWQEENIKNEKEKYVIKRNGFEHHMNDTFVYQIFKPFGVQWSEIQKLKSAILGQPGKTFRTHSHMVLIDRDHIIIKPLVQAITFKPILVSELDLNEMQTFDLPRGKLKIGYKPAHDLHQNNSNILALDASMIKFPLIIRQWLPGDRFQPSGMAGKNQKISDYLTNRKVDRFKKETVTVLADQNQIFWIIGFRKADLQTHATNLKNSTIFIAYQEE